MTRAELIAALEAATGPSRELDAEIACLGYSGRRRSRKRPGCYVENGITRVAPEYTRLLDAALTLAGEGVPWVVGVDQTLPISRWYVATVWTLKKMGDCAEFRGASTPALALCIAALKAGEGKDGG